MEGKKCSKCKKFYSWSDYYADKRAKDNKQSQCRYCIMEKIAQYQKGKGKEKHLEACRKHSTTDKARLSLRRVRAKNPDRTKAQAHVAYQVKRGYWPKASFLECADCNKQACHYHHHKGYNRDNWLIVVPLCQGCHQLRHDNQTL